MTRTHRSRTAALATALVALLLAVPAAAQPVDGWDRFRVTVGIQDATTDVDVALTGAGLPAGLPEVTQIDFEDVFGLDESDELLWAEVEWLLGERSQVSLSYFDLQRDAVRSLDQEVVFGDVVFPFAAEVGSALDLRVAELAYTYWFVRRPDGGLGFQLGVSALDFEARARIRVTLPIFGPVVIEEEVAAAELPVPTVGLEARWAPASLWRVDAEVAWLPRVEVEDWEGEALSWSVDVELRPLSNLGLGLGWSSYDLEADLDEPDLAGELDLSIDGPRAFVRFAF